MAKQDAVKAAVSFAKTYEAEMGHLPLVIDLPIYKFFGNDWVKVVEINMYDEVSNAEVTIEDGWGERKRIQFNELSLYDRY